MVEEFETSSHRFRLSRRAALIAPVLGAFVAKVAGAQAQDSEPKSGGSLTFATNIEPPCLDPHITATDAANSTLRHVVDSLVAEAEDGTIVPWLASSYEVSDDVTTYTFTLREGVTFSDGTVFDAEAVKANFDFIADPANGSQYSISLLGPYQESTVIDPQTVQVTFSEPYAPFLQALTQANLGIVAPSSIEAGNTCAGIIGSGPFVIDQVNPQESLVVVRNDAYNWAPESAAHQGPAYLDQVEFRWLPEDAVRTGSLAAGEIDAANVIPPREVQTFVDDGFNLTIANEPGAPYLVFLNQSRPIFSDVNVRKAFRQSLDLDGIVETLYVGQQQRAWSPIGPITFAYDQTVESSWSYDVDAANALLDEAGWIWDGDFRAKDGEPLAVHWPIVGGNRDQRLEIGQFIKEQTKKVGFDVQIEAVGLSPYLEAAQQNTYDIGDFGFVRNDPDVLRSLFLSTNISDENALRQNWAHVSDAQLDEWLTAASQTLDDPTRLDQYSKVQQFIVDSAAVVPVYVTAEIYAERDGVYGTAIDPQGYPKFYDTWVE